MVHSVEEDLIVGPLEYEMDAIVFPIPWGLLFMFSLIIFDDDVRCEM